MLLVFFVVVVVKASCGNISAFMASSKALKYKFLQVQRIERDEKGLCLSSDFYVESLIARIVNHGATSVAGFFL